MKRYVNSCNLHQVTFLYILFKISNLLLVNKVCFVNQRFVNPFPSFVSAKNKPNSSKIGIKYKDGRNGRRRESRSTSC